MPASPDVKSLQCLQELLGAWCLACLSLRRAIPDHGTYAKVLYSFGYKMEFSFQSNPKNLDPSYKMDLDLRDC